MQEGYKTYKAVREGVSHKKGIAASITLDFVVLNP